MYSVQKKGTNVKIKRLGMNTKGLKKHLLSKHNIKVGKEQNDGKEKDIDKKQQTIINMWEKV